jgi:pimeloyl-ACP methyl ester carboxylesterase
MSTNLLCLHGWGGSKESFTELRQALKGTDITLYTPDLPGFGDTPEPSSPMTVDGYADWVLKYIKEQGIKNNTFLLGHSHGGRIAIKLVTEKNLEPAHLFLCAAAGIRHPRHFKRAIGLMLAKGGKILFSIPGLKSLEPLGKKVLYKLVRVHDYEKASDVMRKTLIKVSQEDLRPNLKDIHIPTDLFWGIDDGMTPFSDAKIMEQEIPNAILHRYPGVRHRVHRDKAEEIASIIQSHL